MPQEQGRPAAEGGRAAISGQKKRGHSLSALRSQWRPELRRAAGRGGRGSWDWPLRTEARTLKGV